MISETVVVALITALVGSGGIGAVLAYLGKRSSDRLEAVKQSRAEAVEAERQKTANALAAEQQNQKNMQELIVTLNQQVSALRLQQSEDRGTFRADITALTETNNKLEMQIDQLRQENWNFRRDLDEYKRCPSPTCPFRASKPPGILGQVT